MQTKSYDFRITFTPDGTRIDHDLQTGAPVRVTIDGVEFVPKELPQRDSWRGWPQLDSTSKPVRMEFK